MPTATAIQFPPPTPGSGQAPLVTVLMGVYNTSAYVRETIDSILQQTLTDFEFLIYNDGSTDDTAEVVRSYTDPRIQLVDNQTNRGVSPNMNEGIAKARGRYIARMDGDDIAEPERLARQVAYMEAHPEVGLCGSAVRYFGSSSAVITLPLDNDTIQHTMWLHNSFFQPAVIIRTSVLREHNLGYNRQFDPAEDYKLWSDMCAVTKVHNLPEVLLNYRIHAHQISRRQSVKQQKSMAMIRREQMDRLHIRLLPAQERAFELLTLEDGWGNFTLADYKAVAALLEDLCRQAQKTGVAPAVIYQPAAEQWKRILGAARHYRPALLPYIVHQPFRRYLPKAELGKLLVKCLIGWRVRPVA